MEITSKYLPYLISRVLIRYFKNSSSTSLSFILFMFKSEVFQGIIQLAQLAFEEIVETFQYLEDWEDRYRHIIELGKAMPKLEIVSKTDNNKVNGCASQVWIDCSIELSIQT